MRYTTRNYCRKEPAKYVPTTTEVEVINIPENFPKPCQKMIGKIYPAIKHRDSQGKTWYKILKGLVFGESEDFNFNFAFSKKNTEDTDKVSFKNRKYIALPAKYCE